MFIVTINVNIWYKWRTQDTSTEMNDIMFLVSDNYFLRILILWIINNCRFYHWALYPMMLPLSVNEVIYTLKKQLPVTIKQNDYKLKNLVSCVSRKDRMVIIAHPCCLERKFTTHQQKWLGTPQQFRFRVICLIICYYNVVTFQAVSCNGANVIQALLLLCFVVLSG